MNSKLITLVAILVTFIVTGCGSSFQQMPMQAAGDYQMGAYGVGPQQMMVGPVAVPPKNVGFLNVPARTCRSGPLAIEFVNESDNFVALQFDGLDVAVVGAQGQLPSFVPPHASVYTCMDEPGPHSITGAEYTLSGSRMVRLFDLRWNGMIGAHVNGYGHHLVRLTGSGVEI